MMQRAVLFLFITIAALGQVSAQSIRTSISRKDILIGEPIQYTLSISLPSKDFRVSAGIPDSVPHFEIISKTAGDSIDKKGNYAQRINIIFTSFDSGSYTFPAFQYRISRGGSASQPLLSDSFRVNVGYMPVDAGGQPRDIKTVINVKVFDWFWIYLGAALLLLLIIILLLYRYFKRRKKRPENIYKGMPTAYDEAIAALNDLRAKNHEQSIAVKVFYTLLADVFKRYYTRTGTVNFSNKTTTEILANLRGHQLQAQTVETTARALNTGDAVKFAKYHPTYTENETALDYIQKTVEEMNAVTKPLQE